MSEKITDTMMMNEYKAVFGHVYHTENNKKLFGKFIPDGWDIIDDKILLILENKRSIKYIEKAKQQDFSYYELLSDEIKKQYNIYLINAFGKRQEIFEYIIYDTNGNIIEKTLNDIKTEINPIDTEITAEEIHQLNQYIYTNFNIKLPKSQKTLFIALILICLKIDNNIIDDKHSISDNSFTIAKKLFDAIDISYNDVVFRDSFKFILTSIHNKHIYEIYSIIRKTIFNSSKDILNMFYSEFCLWDNNDDASLGVVLTPSDIVSMMVKELQLNSNDKVCDFCTGTGSFLKECSKHTKHVYGCENNNERFTLAKCNFILNNLDINNIKYGSCFDVKYNQNEFDKVIINPPFGKNNEQGMNTNNLTHWKDYNNERKFLMYAVEILKVGGTGVCIIPMSNFSNGNKRVIEFKKEFLKYAKVLKTIKCNSKVFSPYANVRCTIIVFQKITPRIDPLTGYNINVYDYSEDGYDIKNNCRIKTSTDNIRQTKMTIEPNTDWNYNVINKNIITSIPSIASSFTKSISYNINTFQKPLEDMINSVIDEAKFTKVNLCDIFEILKVKTFPSKSPNGIYPLYGATKENIPSCYIDKYSIDADDIDKENGVICINKTGNGGAGILHRRKGKFAIMSTVWVLKCKIYIDDINVAYLSEQLHNIFDRANSLNETKFNETEIELIQNEYLTDKLNQVIKLSNRINEMLNDIFNS